MSIVLRPVVPADIPALTALARRTFEETFRGTCTDEDMASFLDSSYTEPLFGKALQDSLVHLWIAEADGEAAGYLQAAEGPLPYPGPVLKPFELQRLYVDAAHHGQGMAATLMQQYLDVAKDLEAPYLWLGVWEHNLRAQAFYRKWGFGPTGHTHPFPIGNTPQTDQWWSRTL